MKFPTEIVDRLKGMLGKGNECTQSNAVEWRVDDVGREKLRKILSDTGDIGEHPFFLLASSNGLVEDVVILDKDLMDESSRLSYEVDVQEVVPVEVDGRIVKGKLSRTDPQEIYDLIKVLGEKLSDRDISKKLLVFGHSHPREGGEGVFRYSPGDLDAPSKINALCRREGIDIPVTHFALLQSLGDKSLMVVNPIEEMNDIAIRGPRQVANDIGSVQILSL